MLKLCGKCETLTDFRTIQQPCTVFIRDRTVTAICPVLECPKCKDIQPADNPDTMEPLYAEYERLTGIDPRWENKNGQ